jgi:excisionase family DNA binding protein
MLMHEWRQYRDRQIRKVIKEAREGEEPAAETAPEAAAPPVDEAAPAAAVAEAAEETTAVAPVAVSAPAAAPPVSDPLKFEPEQPTDILDKLAAGNDDLRERLQALRARQQVLPLDVEAAPPPPPKTRLVGESREELVQRLLDPVLSLEEAATLLDVCPTTVRRYTNRGILRCHRTPGNQRRFRLSEVMDFMERRQTQDES